MTIWTLELLQQSSASLTKLTQALDKDMPKQRPGESAKSTLQNLQTAAALGVQEVILVSQNGEAVAIASVRHDIASHVGYARLLYVMPGIESAVADMLVQEVFERVWRVPEISAFDGQAFVDQADIRTAFAARGLMPIARQNMTYKVDPTDVFVAVPNLPPGFRISPWWPQPGLPLPDGHLDAVADLIVEAYHGTIDEYLYPGLNTRPGVRQFLEEILFEKQSSFDPAASAIVYSTVGTEKMVAQIFCSKTRDNHTFVLEVATDSHYRRAGLAKALLTHTLNAARSEGLAGVQLTVSLDNPARHLYESLGFVATVPLWVYTTERQKMIDPADSQS